MRCLVTVCISCNQRMYSDAMIAARSISAYILTQYGGSLRKPMWAAMGCNQELAHSHMFKSVLNIFWHWCWRMRHESRHETRGVLRCLQPQILTHKLHYSRIIGNYQWGSCRSNKILCTHICGCYIASIFNNVWLHKHYGCLVTSFHLQNLFIIIFGRFWALRDVAPICLITRTPNPRPGTESLKSPWPEA